MVGIPGLYFVIACDEFARFVRPDTDDGLHTIEVVDSSSISDRDDLGGPAAPSARFARLLAAVIEEDLAVDLFTHLVLVAPPDLLRELRASLSPSAHASLVGSLAKRSRDRARP